MKNQLHQKNLLVVEPQPLMEGLPRVLGARGWQFDVVPGPLDALVRLAREPFAAIVFDEDVLPQAPNALDEARRLCPHVAIIATLKSSREVPGADDWIALPCLLNEFVRVLERACENQTERRKLAQIESQIEQLNSKLREQKSHLAALEKVSHRLGKAVSELRPLLRTALELFREVAGAERLSLMLLEENGPEELRILEAHGISEDVIAQTRLKVGEGVAGWVAKHGRALLGTTRTGPYGLASERNAYTSNPFVSVPLKVGDEVLGVVNLTNRVDGRPFSEAELKVLELLAEQTAAWIRHSQKLQKMQRLSLIDEVTTLYNRRYLTSCLQREIKRAGRTGEQLSLAMLDLDHFKVFNDTYGHQAGDRLLRQFATMLQDSIRSSDIVCRYAGDEFVIILPETTQEKDRGNHQGSHFLERLRAVVSEYPFEGQQVLPGGNLTVSVGVAVFPDDGRGPDELISVADEMLYEAKRRGRNRVCLRRRPPSQAEQQNA